MDKSGELQKVIQSKTYASRNKMLIEKDMSERQIKSFSVQSIIPSFKA